MLNVEKILGSIARTYSKQHAMTSFRHFVMRSMILISILFSLIGLFVLIYFSSLLYTSGRYSSEFIPEITGQIGDFIGGVVGTLFTISAGALLFINYMIHIDEKNASEARHSDMLSLALSEKEFSVVSRAIDDFRRDWEHFDTKPIGGPGQWGERMGQWMDAYTVSEWPSGITIAHRSERIKVMDYPFVIDFLRRSIWIIEAIDTKSLSPDDRRYLAQVFRPSLHHIRTNVVDSIILITNHLQRRIAENDGIIDHSIASMHRKELLDEIQKIIDGADRLHSLAI